MMRQAKLILEDGTEFCGSSFGYAGDTEGEVVFNTAMTGYPESLTDPSYAGQVLVTTFPLIGNYGVPDTGMGSDGLPLFMESDRIHVKALVVADYSESYSHWNAKESLASWLKREKIPAITGVDTSKEASFFSVWQDRINFFRTNNNGEQYTTAESYECAMKSFQKILWDRPITGFKVGKEDIEYWSNGMQNGVLNENGELIGQIREATRGLYLRNCRAVWNECVSRGYLTNQEYPFSNVKKKKLVAIPVGDTRKDHYLNVQQMTELYRVFIEKRYPDTWKKGYAEKAHYSLGLFLVQYLCNGFNMADAAELKYSKFYFDSSRKAFKFKRVKTRNRTEGGGEVIIPIIEPLQKILDEIAAEPVLNGFVFPDILQGATHKADKRKRISQENSNVQDRVIKICEDVLHWEVRPSGTWCRHSYGTNLTHAKVEERYISQSMGHAIDKTITERYIAQYPLETMFEYNNKLLDLQPKVTEEDVKNMTEEEKTKMLLKLLANK